MGAQSHLEKMRRFADQNGLAKRRLESGAPVIARGPQGPRKQSSMAVLPHRVLPREWSRPNPRTLAWQTWRRTENARP